MKKIIKAAGGTTMVEVMVAFVVLILLLGIFSQTMVLAGRMLNRSTDTLEKYHQLAGDYFLDRPDATDENLTELVFKRVTKDGNDTGDGFTMQAMIRTYTKRTGGGSSEVRLYEVGNAAQP